MILRFGADDFSAPKPVVDKNTYKLLYIYFDSKSRFGFNLKKMSVFGCFLVSLSTIITARFWLFFTKKNIYHIGFIKFDKNVLTFEKIYVKMTIS